MKKQNYNSYLDTLTPTQYKNMNYYHFFHIIMHKFKAFLLFGAIIFVCTSKSQIVSVHFQSFKHCTDFLSEYFSLLFSNNFLIVFDVATSRKFATIFTIFLTLSHFQQQLLTFPGVHKMQSNQHCYLNAVLIVSAAST